jgi:hypothetical protein
LDESGVIDVFRVHLVARGVVAHQQNVLGLEVGVHQREIVEKCDSGAQLHAKHGDLGGTKRFVVVLFQKVVQ